jgi:uncharacterized protein YdiU (UPF0061 family)
MFHLEVPTTRSLSLLLTGDQVLRDVMYDGHPTMKRGRGMQSGSILYPFWEFRTFSSQNDLKTLKSLADFSIKYHFPE